MIPAVTKYRSGSSPTDPDYADVSLLLHGIGSNGGTTFTDNSPLALTPSAIVGGAETSTAEAHFGSSSIHLPSGNTSALRYSQTVPWDFGTSDFTLEALVYLVGTSGAAYDVICASWDGSVNTGVFFAVETSTRLLRCFINGGHFVWQGPSVIPLNVWTSVAMTRQGINMNMYIGGISTPTPENLTSGESVTFSPNGLGIGCESDGTLFANEMYIQELRITNGVARYAGNYTPATAPFPNS